MRQGSRCWIKRVALLYSSPFRFNLLPWVLVLGCRFFFSLLLFLQGLAFDSGMNRLWADPVPVSALLAGST